MRRTRRAWMLAAGMTLLVAAVAFAAPGDLDPTFGTNGKTFLGGNESNDLVVDPGGATFIAEGSDVARLTPGGELDEAFGKDGYIENTIPFPYALALQPDGKVVVAGQDVVSGTADYFAAVTRYLPDGTPDNTFSGDGVVTLTKAGPDEFEQVWDVAIQPDGKIVVVGYTKKSTFIARYNPDGTPDPGFSGDGAVVSDFGFASAYLTEVAPGPGGSVYAAGSAYDASEEQDMLLVRVDSTGAPDPAFAGDGVATVEFGRDDEAENLLVQPDGKVLAAGTSRAQNSSKSKAAFARFTPAGAADTTFSGDGTLTMSEISRVAGLGLGPSGTIYAAGGSVRVIRMLADGSMDSSWSGDGTADVQIGPFSEGAEALAVAPDGRVLVSGSSFLSKDDIVVGVARLLAAPGPPDADGDGVLDDDDECDYYADPENDGCPFIARELTLSKKNGTFHGTVTAGTSSDGITFSVELLDCEYDGRVSVYRVKRGPDKLIGQVASKSSWKLNERVGKHKYYAVLKEHLRTEFAICGAAKSKVLRG